MERRKFVIGLGAMATGAAAATGTGALTAARLDGRDANISVTDDSDSLLQLTAGDTDATFEEDGELNIDFGELGTGGINPNARYQVGMINSTGANAIDSYVQGDPTPDVSTSDVLYQESVDEDNTAFTLKNQTDQDLNVEIFYEGGDPGDAGTAVLVGASDNNQPGAAAFAIDPSNLDGGRLGGFPLTVGEEFHVSILVKTGSPQDAGEDSMDEINDWDGEIFVQASPEDVGYVDT